MAVGSRTFSLKHSVRLTELVLTEPNGQEVMKSDNKIYIFRT
jgi:hypothetical protein